MAPASGASINTVCVSRMAGVTRRRLSDMLVSLVALEMSEAKIVKKYAGQLCCTTEGQPQIAKQSRKSVHRCELRTGRGTACQEDFEGSHVVALLTPAASQISAAEQRVVCAKHSALCAF